MFGLRRTSTSKNLHVYLHILTLLVVIICEAQGEMYPSKWKTSETDIDYVPMNRMMMNALLDNTGHHNNNDDYRRISTREAKLVPPERPAIFESPEALRAYLLKLNEYFAIIGRPR
ncbi:unnamed protein product [Trichobilharzia regenti]|nr:unnamed protein product [Trichobilharzia regenti]